MRKTMMIFVVLFLIVTVAWLSGSVYMQMDLFTQEEYGDPPIGEPLVILGGGYKTVTIEKRVDHYYNESLRLYRAGEKTYLEFIDDVIEFLSKSYEIEAARVPGMIRYVSVDSRSSYRVYIQDDIDRNTSTLFIVEADTPLNRVSVAYQDDYISEIGIDSERNLILIIVRGQVLEMNFKV